MKVQFTVTVCALLTVNMKQTSLTQNNKYATDIVPSGSGMFSAGLICAEKDSKL
jgi:hypothetical protein